MLGKVFSLIVGSKQERELKRLQPKVKLINEIYAGLNKLSDNELLLKTEEFKQRLREGETLDDLLPEAYAVVKEACRRHLGKKWIAGGNEITWDMVPFDVQLMGAIVLHEGKIAEMATGEGKTLVAVMPLYLNALTGRGVHLVTVNDYLAQRDREWMGPIYEFLGLTVGCILMDMDPAERRKQYACDITYGTNNEFGFDYLRDNMAISPDGIVQRGHYYAIVDEVDSVLIDEARTPLIISGPVDRSKHQYNQIKPMVERLVQKQNLLVNRLLAEAEEILEKNTDDAYAAGIKLLQALKGAPKNKRLLKLLQDADKRRLMEKVEIDHLRDKRMPELEAELYYVIDEKGHTIDLTEKGRLELAPNNPEMFVLKDIVDEVAKIEARTDLDPHQREKMKEKVRQEHEIKSEQLHNISTLLRAYSLFERDVDYVVQDNKVIIVDEFTGRLMPGRRWSDGLHQAVEAKEGVEIERETQTLATITIQNYFRMYEKLAGMTGTAATEAQEFEHTYKMEVVVIPTNRPIRRTDYDDLVYRTKREKYNAVIDEIERLHQRGLPVLVGTISVEVSELLSRMLRRKNISHNILNAKNHAKEAQIVKDAGQPGMVTIATNMAGRGTDIKLGHGVVKCEACCIRCNEDCAKYPPCAGKKKREDYLECYDDMPCGLHIIGTERHEARRIDNQLRGRAGRQGDPGASRFFLSLEDDLLRLFGSEKITSILAKFGMNEGEPIFHPLMTKTISGAQKRIENMNFERRKKTLEYDDVLNKQRDAIYDLRREVMLSKGEDLKQVFLNICYEAMASKFEREFGDPQRSPDDWNLEGFFSWLKRIIPFINLEAINPDDITKFDEFLDAIMPEIKKAYELKAAIIGTEINEQLTRFTLLRVIDMNWQDQLLAIDELRESIHLRAYAERDPLIEYKRDATRLFTEMMFNIYTQGMEHYFRAQVITEEEQRRRIREMRTSKEDYAALAVARQLAMAQGEQTAGEHGEEAPVKIMPVRRQGPKIGRNEPCPCGSGKKYKKCCGSPTSLRKNPG